MTRAAAAALYAAGSLPLWLAASRACRPRRWMPWAAAVAAAALAFRAALAYLAPGNYDLNSYGFVLDALDRGKVVYEETKRYNYSPVWWHVLAAAHAAARATGIPDFLVIRLVTTAGDVAIAAALAAWHLRRSGARRAAAVALLYFTNPLAVGVSSAHGQFDALALAPAVFGLGLAASGATLLPAFLVGAGVAVKQVVLLFAPALLGFSRTFREKARDMLVAALPFALLLLPWLIAVPAAVVRNVGRYSGVYGYWGWYSFLHLSGRGLPFPPAIVTFSAAALGGGLAWLLAARTGDGLRGARAASLAFLSLTPGFSLQMLLWPVAFLPAKGRERWPLAVYTLAGTAVYAEFLRTHGYLFPALRVAWLAAAAWLVLILLRTPPAVRGMNRHGH